MSEEIEYIIEESLSPDRYCLVHNYIVSLQQKVEQLENIRKEAIEYVKSKEFAENFPYVMNECQVRSFLLNILNKGDNK